MVASPTSWRRAVAAAVLPLSAMLVAACGSDPATTGPAAARENVAPAVAAPAATAPACTDPSSGATTSCATGKRGPGGGIVFYDAQSPQPWGRFLEVAPQNWNGTLYQCPGSNVFGSSCGAADGVAKATSDAGGNAKQDTGSPGAGYIVCSFSSSAYEKSVALAGVAGTTGTAIGAGRNNTSVLLAATDCTVAGDPNAVSVAAGYRGGGLSDWYLPAKDELNALCAYSGRNAIGGFPDEWYYASSTAYPRTDGGTTYTSFTTEQFGSKSCPMSEWGNFSACVGCNPGQLLVRPIRAF